MSEPVSALQHAEFNGCILVKDAGPRGMITIRGDLTSAALRSATHETTGVDFPDVGEAKGDGEHGLCWMSPDELLVLLPYDSVEAAAASISKGLSGEHSLVAPVSDARALFRLEGEGDAIRDVLAKLTPADLRNSAFPIGRIRRTRLSQVPAAIWFQQEDVCELICFRSVAEYVFNLLKNAAADGRRVGHF